MPWWHGSNYRWQGSTVTAVPIAVTQVLACQSKNDGTTSYTSGTISPTTGQLLLLCTDHAADDDLASITGTLTGTWTKLSRAFNGRSASIWYSTDYGSSGTVIMNINTTSRMGMWIGTVTGTDLDDPFAQTATDVADDNTQGPSISLAQAPTDTCFGWITENTGRTWVAQTGYTKHSESTFIRAVSKVKPGGQTCTGDSQFNTDWQQILTEFKAA